MLKTIVCSGFRGAYTGLAILLCTLRPADVRVLDELTIEICHNLHVVPYSWPTEVNWG